MKNFSKFSTEELESKKSDLALLSANDRLKQLISKGKSQKSIDNDDYSAILFHLKMRKMALNKFC